MTSDEENDSVGLDDTSLVSLPPTVELTADGLHDSIRGHTYELNRTARELLDGLLTGVPLGVALTAQATRYDIPEATVRADTYELMRDFNSRALIHVQTRRRPGAAALRYLKKPVQSLKILFGRVLSLEPPTFTARRMPPTLGSVLRASLVVTVGSILVGVATTLILFAVLFASADAQLSSTTLRLAASPLWAAALISGSIILHELGHLLTVPDRDRSVVVHRAYSVSVAHPVLHGSQRKIVALAGPVLGSLWCAVGGLVVVVAGWPSIFGFFAALVAATHLYSLTPWNPDGRMLWSPGSSAHSGKSAA